MENLYVIQPMVRNATQHQMANTIKEQWEKNPLPNVEAEAENPKEIFDPDEPIGLLYIPSWGKGYVATIENGVEESILKNNVGHYKFTAMPGELGNCSLAGHRFVNSGLFHKLNELVPGDILVVETKMYLYTYEIYSEVETVDPQKIDEIYATPHQTGVQPVEKLITLQACTLGYREVDRLIVHGKLIEQKIK